MPVGSLQLDTVLFKRIVRESFRGKTLARIFLNHALAGISVTGNILDLGSSSASASYHRFLQYTPPYQVTHTDFFRAGAGIIQLDLEQPFPLNSDVYDGVTCFNVLEHIFNYQNVVGEAYRVLKPGGTFIVGVPFLVNYHADPHDYFRYTPEALERICSTAGFTIEDMTALSLGPCTVAAEYVNRVLPSWLHGVSAVPAVLLDALILRLKPAVKSRYALGYVFVAKK